MKATKQEKAIVADIKEGLTEELIEVKTEYEDLKAEFERFRQVNNSVTTQVESKAGYKVCTPLTSSKS